MSMFKMSMSVTSRCWAISLLVVGGLAGTATQAETALDPIAPRLASADPARGEKVFLQCKACHVAEEGAQVTVGPNLWGVINRPVGSQPDYDYSDSLKAIGGHWDYETLSRYLFDPKAMAPESRMLFDGVKSARERADLLAYLRTLAHEPVALPDAPADSEGPLYGGLPAGEGREAVYFTCRACHALEQFTDRSLSREEWDTLLDDMVRENGMADPETWARGLMLDYLSVNFGAKQDWQDLPPGPGREEVFYTCKACHSLMLVTQQGMSRPRWDDTLEWMVEEQGMDEIDDVATRDLILDYLSTHFGSG
jgi:cytochrome c